MQDSWRRAFTFRHQYEALLRRAGRCDGIGLAPGQSLGGVSLQPLVDEVRGKLVTFVTHTIQKAVIVGLLAALLHL